MSGVDPRVTAGFAELTRVLPAFGLRVRDVLEVPPVLAHGAGTSRDGALRVEVALDRTSLRPAPRRGVLGVQVRVGGETDEVSYGVLGDFDTTSRSALRVVTALVGERPYGFLAAASNESARAARVALEAGPYAGLLGEDVARVREVEARVHAELPGTYVLHTLLVALGAREDDRTVAADGAAILTALADGAPLEWVARRFPGLVS